MVLPGLGIKTTLDCCHSVGTELVDRLIATCRIKAEPFAIFVTALSVLYLIPSGPGADVLEVPTSAIYVLSSSSSIESLDPVGVSVVLVLLGS